MGEQATYADDVGGLSGAQHGILQQGDAEPFAMPRQIHREPAEDGHGDRIRHVATNRSGRVVDSQGPRGQAVVTDHPGTFGRNISARRTGDLVGASAPLQPVVEAGLSAFKPIQFVFAG